MRVTGGRTNEELANLIIRGSAGCVEWMRAQGARFQQALGGTLHMARTNAFFLGGGKALMNTYYAAAERRGVRVMYGAEVVDLQIVEGQFDSATVSQDGSLTGIRAKTFVAASGGFEANLEWLKAAWGKAAENFLVRGTAYNKGKVLELLLGHGAERIGDPKQCHALAIDARAPKFDGGIVTRLDCLPLGVVVNNRCERFYDEGEDLWPKRYAIWGRLIAEQPDQIAYSIIDAKVVDQFMPSVYQPMRADTVGDLARAIGLAPGALQSTIERFNRSVVPGCFDFSRLDDCTTSGLSPDKTHWAQRIDTAPFYAYPLRPGITFTYLGVKVNSKAQVLMDNGRAAPNVFAAGEIMAGNILGQGYLGGVGMVIGTVFGRIAGEEAARATR